MKKIMIAAIAVAFAAVAQAAALKWSMANGVLATSPDGSASSGRCSYYTMLVFTDAQADLVNTALTVGKDGKVDFAALSGAAVSTAQSAKAGSFSGIVNNLSGSSANLFAVVFDTYSTTETIADAGYFYQTGIVTQSTYDPSGSDPATTAVFTADQMTGTWTSTEIVPEPTSGLLLLLGMGALALRRKQA